MPKWFNKWCYILANLNLAGLCAVFALFHDAGWVRDWLWFVTGTLAGYALFWLFHEFYAERSRQKMREEMIAIGADIVRRMHEQIGLGQMPTGIDDQQPPRMH